MAYYSDSEAFYGKMKALFACVETKHPQATDSIAGSRLIIKLIMREPQAEIVIDGRQRPVKTTFGVDGVKPDLEVDMEADTFHRVLLGELPLQKAFGSGQMRVKGNIFRAMTLGNLITVSQRCYPEIWRG
jgi:putative sterol carrier protein